MRYGTQCLKPTDRGTPRYCDYNVSQLADDHLDRNPFADKAESVRLARESWMFQRASHRENMGPATGFHPFS